jgi:accessory gene regulator protein AgrB
MSGTVVLMSVCLNYVRMKIDSGNMAWLLSSIQSPVLCFLFPHSAGHKSQVVDSIQLGAHFSFSKKLKS